LYLDKSLLGFNKETHNQPI